MITELLRVFGISFIFTAMLMSIIFLPDYYEIKFKWRTDED